MKCRYFDVDFPRILFIFGKSEHNYVSGTKPKLVRLQN